MCQCVTSAGIIVHYAVATLSGRTPTAYSVGGHTVLGFDALAAPRIKKEPEPKDGETEPGTTVRIKASRNLSRHRKVVRGWNGSASLCLAQILAPQLCACSLNSPSLLAHKGVASFELVMPSNRGPGRDYRGPGRDQVDQYRGRATTRHYHSRERGNDRDIGRQDEFYDKYRTRRIPQEQWSTGQEPEENAVHFDVYVYGRAHGGPPAGIHLDGEVTMDKGGSHPLEDPERDKKGRYGSQSGFNQCDGNNKFIKHRVLQFLRRHPAALRVLAEQAENGVRAAKRRPKVRKGNLYVHCAALGVGCRQGRHRSTVVANAIATLMRSIGATVKVHYCHLFKGVHDARGPCGCHLGPYCCQTIARKYNSLDFFDKLAEDEGSAEAESEGNLQHIFAPIKDAWRRSGFSAVVGQAVQVPATSASNTLRHHRM